MFFIILIFTSALILELLGSYISIIGLAKNTSYIMIAIAIAWDFSKIMVATVLYKKWNSIHKFLKFAILPPFIFLILFTSAGSYAFLVQEFSKTTLGQEQASIQITSLEEEKIRLESRKTEIDKQISEIPPTNVTQKRRLTEMFSQELQHINNRIIELDKEIPLLKIQNVKDTSQSGTISSIAKTYSTTPDKIIKIVVFFMVLALDPLAILLLTIANFLVEQRKKELKEHKNVETTTLANEIVSNNNLDKDDIDNIKISFNVKKPTITSKTLNEQQYVIQRQNIINNKEQKFSLNFQAVKPFIKEPFFNNYEKNIEKDKFLVNSLNDEKFSFNNSSFNLPLIKQLSLTMKPKLFQYQNDLEIFNTILKSKDEQKFIKEDLFSLSDTKDSTIIPDKKVLNSGFDTIRAVQDLDDIFKNLT